MKRKKKEERVSNDATVVLRLPKNMVARAKALSKQMGTDPQFHGLRLTMSAVCRIAMFKGIQELEKVRK